MCIWTSKSSLSILSRKLDLKLENIPIVVLACFILHNFCELHNDNIDVEAVRAQIDWDISEDGAHKNILDPVYSGTTKEGETVRDTKTDYILTNMPDYY